MQNLMPPVNTPGNVFDDGDPSTGFPGSVVPAQWLNDVQFSIRDLQQECKNILASAGITPDPKKQQQLAEAIRKLIQNNVPNASTTTPGIVKLSNVINSNSDTQAATSQAVKTVFEMVSAANRDATTANNNANIRLEKRLNGADIPDKAAFVSNVGAYPKTGGVISGEVICQRVTIEADTPYLTAFDTNGTRQFF
ncbi:tail fiber protein, partial [Xenorhabdus cabanillasii]|uniref:tail fiber protein n=2 Tax=Xenorhabdus cabanillasii TaxID=351673 RepID=UPI00159BC871